MKISNRVKRNISFTLMLVGLGCTAARAWAVMTNPASGRAWFELIGIIILTYLCLDNFTAYRVRLKKALSSADRLQSLPE